jgi:hypothetical protein
VPRIDEHCHFWAQGLEVFDQLDSPLVRQGDYPQGRGQAARLRHALRLPRIFCLARDDQVRLVFNQMREAVARYWMIIDDYTRLARLLSFVAVMV